MPRLTGSGAERDADLAVRLAATRAGVWLGWCSVLAVLAALAIGDRIHHRVAVAILTAAAGLANAFPSSRPGRRLLGGPRSDVILALWSAGLIAVNAASVLLAGTGAGLELAMFLVVAFLATIHAGAGRVGWLTVAIGVDLAATVLGGGLGAGAIVLRGGLWAGAAILAVALADFSRRQTAATIVLRERAELERVLLAEAHHRVKNSLQTVADLLLLGRPEDPGSARAFDETATRIGAIAAVHRLLADSRGADVPADQLLATVRDGIDPGIALTAASVRLDPARAQQLGIAANELLANAVGHGRPPVRLVLEVEDDCCVLQVIDHGPGPSEPAGPPGLGLTLVRRVVGQGLGGAFDLRRRDGATVAEARFPAGVV